MTWNAAAEQPLGEHRMADAKYARCDAGDGATSLARATAGGGAGQAFGRGIVPGLCPVPVAML